MDLHMHMYMHEHKHNWDPCMDHLLGGTVVLRTVHAHWVQELVPLEVANAILAHGREPESESAGSMAPRVMRAPIMIA